MRVVPARNGWYWVRDGARLFARSPVGWMLLVFSYYLIMTLIGAIPIAGPLIGVMLVPAFAVSFMNVALAADRTALVSPRLLFSGLRRNASAVITLGGVYILSLAAILGLSALGDGGELARFLLAGKTPDPTADMTGLLIAMVAYIPVLAAFWFSPALVAWAGLSAPKSLFFSLFAAWRNWSAMLVYGLAVSALVVGLTWIMITILQMTGAIAPGADRGPGAFVVFLFTPVVLAVIAIIFASFYACYRDVFPDNAPPSEDAPGR